MATTSFNKDFVISNKENIESFQEKLEKPRKIKVIPRDLKADQVKGIQLLQQQMTDDFYGQYGDLLDE